MTAEPTFQVGDYVVIDHRSHGPWGTVRAVHMVGDRPRYDVCTGKQIRDNGDVISSVWENIAAQRLVTQDEACDWQESTGTG